MNNGKLKIIVAVVVLALGFWLLKAFWLDRPTLITVVGEGRAIVAPEMVKFTVNLLNKADTATLAVADNNRLSRDIIAILKNNGVEEKDINLAYVRIVPPSAALGQTQYQALNSIDATLRRVAVFDNLFAQLYASGAQSITNIIFTVENSRDLEKQVVAEAIKDAKARAREMAKASGKRVGRMVSIVTGEIGEAGALSGKAPSQLGEGQIMASPTQIEITRQASIVFELR